MANLEFSSVAELRSWFKTKRREFWSEEAFCAWVVSFFDDGNTISVRGEEYDYWACLELI